MGKFNYGMHKFSTKASLNSNKLLVRNRFLKYMDSKLNELYNKYIDFVILIYDKMNDKEDISYITKVHDMLKLDIRESCVDSLKNNYDFNSKVTYEDLNKCIDDLISINVYNVMNYCRKSCMYYMMNNFKNILEDASKTEDFIFLSTFDNAFLKIFRVKFNSLRDGCLEFMKYTDSTLLDDCYFNVTYSLKDPILDLCHDCMRDVLPYELTIDKKSVSDGILRDFGIKIFDEHMHHIEEDNSYDTDEVLVEEQNLVFIDDYRELNKMAEDNGFEYVRCNGDHGIFKSNSGMVVIPQGRSIGKGLSIKIQKTINRYKAC